VNIWLEDVPDAILEAVKARLMRRRKDLQEDKEQQNRKPGEPGPQIKEFGGDSDEWRRPEPGAVANRVFVVAHGPSLNKATLSNYGSFQFLSGTFGFLANNVAENIPSAFEWKVWSGNQANYLSNSETLDFDPGPEPGFSVQSIEGGQSWSARLLAELYRRDQCITIALPAGKDTCIIIKLFRYVTYTLNFDFTSTYWLEINSLTDPIIVTYWGSYPNGVGAVYDPPGVLGGNPFEAPDGVSVDAYDFISTAKAYLCTKRTVKEIEIKEPLKSIIDHMNPPDLELVSYQYLPGWSAVSIPLDVTLPELADFSVGFYDRPREDNDPPIVTTWTPAIFRRLYEYAIDNDLELPLNTNDLKDFPPSVKPLLTDFKGYYSNDSDNKSLYYAQWKGDRDEVVPGDTENYKSLNQATLKIPNAQDPLPSSTTIHAVWDWNDPVYCRLMCLELGFEPADLRP
jgi:hypothetical protein